MDKEVCISRVELKNRKELSVTGVNDVISYCENTVVLKVEEAILTVDGEGLTIVKLNLEESVVIVEGIVCGLIYSDEQTRSKGFFKGLFR